MAQYAHHPDKPPFSVIYMLFEKLTVKKERKKERKKVNSIVKNECLSHFYPFSKNNHCCINWNSS